MSSRGSLGLCGGRWLCCGLWVRAGLCWLCRDALTQAMRRCGTLTPVGVLLVVAVLCPGGQGLRVLGTAARVHHGLLKAGVQADLGRETRAAGWAARAALPQSQGPGLRAPKTSC